MRRREPLAVETEREGDRVRPSDFVKKYQNLTVRTRIGGELTVHANKYFMKGTKGLEEAEKIKKKEKDLLRQAAVENLASAGLQVSLDDSVVRRIFDGKGSPGDIATLIEAAIFVEAIADDSYTVQKFCDEHIGVDCSGFVDAYFRTESRGSTEKLRGHRKEATQIQPQDVLFWYDYNAETKKLAKKPDVDKVGHVALVDTPPVSTGEGLGVMTVCESRGGGIGVSTNLYTIREALQDDEKHTIYRVDCLLRGLDKTKTDRDNYVRVYPAP